METLYTRYAKEFIGVAARILGTGRLTHVGTSSRVLLAQATEQGRLGHTQEAAVLFHLIVERNDSSSAEAAYLLGKLHQDSRPELATHDFAVAIRLNLSEPLRREAFRRRIEAASAAGLPTAALEESLRVAYPESDAERPAPRGLPATSLETNAPTLP